MLAELKVERRADQMAILMAAKMVEKKVVRVMT